MLSGEGCEPPPQLTHLLARTWGGQQVSLEGLQLFMCSSAPPGTEPWLWEAPWVAVTPETWGLPTLMR